MKDRSFVSRLKKYGGLRLLTSNDFKVSAVIFATLYFFSVIPSSLGFLEASIGFTSSLIAIVLTGLAIIVSLSNSSFISFLKDKAQVFDQLIFLFEWNAYIAIFTTLVGLATVANGSIWLYRFFTFLLLYLSASILNLIAFVSYYGQVKAEFDKNNAQ
ncbi:hypothetical protein ACK3SF_03990 [Candidatus Nanosalina sp. VS9-1]|uniref:hypothetical protein n=1 Tax=Candidatus Nanosalina sp. VS9-1 TaxID=3388566 RepID=UPI0039DFA1D3